MHQENQMDEQAPTSEPEPTPGSDLSRRGFLAGAAALGAGAMLPYASPASAAARALLAHPAAAPKRGGLLRVAHVGGGNEESFNPGKAQSDIDASRAWNLYDPLNRVNPDFTLAPGLAVEWNANKSATVWEVKLRQGVTWHNGKTFTADDVIFTFQQNAKPGNFGSTAVQNVDLGGLKKLNNYTLKIPLKTPNGSLPYQFVLQQNVIIQDGQTNFSHPVGTGAFVFQSFIPGQHSICTANKNYWDNGKPYVAEWEDISIPDPTARLNALLSGQIDAMQSIDFATAKVYQSSSKIKLLNVPSPVWQVFLMRVDTAPFNDNRVREAMRLIVDRHALIEGALSGFGTPGNDLFGKGMPYFASDLPIRHQDIAKAKSLLKAAGHANMTVQLDTSNIVPGFVQAATLFAQQAAKAGVTIKVKQDPASSYFNASLLYTHVPFGQSNWQAASLSTFYQPALMTNGVFNETHWKSKAYDGQINSAIAAASHASAEQRWHAVQEVQYNQGGYIGWANVNNVDALAPYVKGVVGNGFWNLGAFDYRDWWLDK
jgi:peptide/nickel transport system substrate-binding protein